MNNVSLLLYAVDVVYNISVLITIFLIVGGIFGGVGSMIYRVESGRFHPLSIVLFILIPLSATVLTFIPSRVTLLAIATSEFVEDFSQTETGTEISALASETLDYLKAELKKLKEE